MDDTHGTQADPMPVMQVEILERQEGGEMKATYYEITKTYRNGCDKYYIELSPGETITDEMLESIGDSTNGGLHYGYRMESRKIAKLPKDAKLLSRTMRRF